LVLPEGFEAPIIDTNNTLSEAKISLGRKLFFDPIISNDSSLSCGSCHLPEKAFTDGLPLSKGVEGRIGTRNTPTLANMAWHPYFFMEGGSPSLALQMLGPIQEPHEMDLPFPVAVERIKSNPTYVREFENAFGKGPDNFTFTRAIAAYEISLISGNSPYDKYLNSTNQKILTESQKRGLKLFTNDSLNCSKCHSGFLLTNLEFENNGAFKHYNDLGRYRITSDSSDIGKFKVPTLRNIELTAPYMHNGSYATLDSVLLHYSNGGASHPNQSEFIQGFSLSQSDKADLIAFLRSLTDSSFTKL
jgi:cytochrome c peroxidase